LVSDEFLQFKMYKLVQFLSLGKAILPSNFLRVVPTWAKTAFESLKVHPSSGQSVSAHFELGWTCLPNPVKQHMDAEFNSEEWKIFGAGEDAGFVYPISNEKVTWDSSSLASTSELECVPSDEKTLWIGLADGVGGWARWKGARPQDFSRYLAQYSVDILSETSSRELALLEPQDLMKQSWNKILHNEEHESLLGSSTFTVLRINTEKMQLESANLGDSGYVVVPSLSADPPLMAKQTLHSFNFPYQLASKAATRTDYPSDSVSETHKISTGDVIIAVTDGVFDNMFIEDIEALTRSHAESSMVDLSLAIASVARESSYDEDFFSPYAINARKADRGDAIIGGKVDDICVVSVKIL